MLIVPSDMTISMKFSIARQFVLVSFLFLKGEDATLIIQKFLNDENLPLFIEPQIISCLNCLFNEQTCSLSEDLQAESLIDEKIRQDSKEILAETYEKTCLRWQTKPATASISLKRESSNSSAFTDAFSAILNCDDNELLSKVFQFEMSLQSPLEELIEAKDKALQALQKKQHEEMTEFQKNNTTHQAELLSEIVKKHMFEVEKLEAKWLLKIAQERNNLKSNFIEFILDQSEKNSKKIFKKQYNVARIAGSTNKLLVYLGTSGKIHNLNTFLGFKQKSLYNLQFVCANDPFDPSRQLKNIELQTKHAQCLYSDRLFATVILVHNSLAFDTKYYKALFELCKSSIELHFDSIDEQLLTIKESVKDQQLVVGDVFTTKHSNLLFNHVIFHLVTNEKKVRDLTIDTDAAIIGGLINIFELATQYNIGCISIPLLLLLDDSQVIIENEIITITPNVFLRIDRILTLIKKWFCENNQSSCLNSFRFIIPKSLEIIGNDLITLFTKIFESK
eukprot:TRINITY_DN1335_c1_g4_i1.p1 TRINITY_DN1335_c1_g4~~TRINITY_DN1335_c1_g4_i1.p1  ORF type:complete len:506 (+),score=198.10 TRINITY_DN1335_c1_g4_i1:90-1607(+)